MWRPQMGPQKALIDCPVYEIFYGGARGGGKTDGGLGKMGLKAQSYGRAFNCLFFRRELPQLDDAIERSQDIFGRMGAAWHDQKKTWRFPQGGRLRFRPLERPSDAEKYQGQNVSDVVIEEAGNFPDPAPIQRLHGVLRSTQGIPVQMLLTGNPGGPGQQWLKARYVDPAPMGMKIIRETINYQGQEIIRSRVYIPARVQDNRMLSDPAGYVASLHMVGSEQLVRAWLEGDFDVVSGAYFDCFRKEWHVVKPFKIPEHWTRFRSEDWGTARPFSIGWYAVASETVRTPCGKVIPRGALIKYREWYGVAMDGSGNLMPNVGIKATLTDVGRGIVEREAASEKLAYHVADPAMWLDIGGPTQARSQYEAIQEAAKQLGKPHSDVFWRKGNNQRIRRGKAKGGWDQMRERLIGEEQADGVRRPMLYFFETCVHSIRTIPSLQHDEVSPEDLDSDGEDHAADECRYACMSRPYESPKPTEKKPMTDLSDVSLNRLWKEQERRAW